MKSFAMAGPALIVDPVGSRPARRQPGAGKPGGQPQAVAIGLDQVHPQYGAVILLIFDNQVAGVRIGVRVQAGPSFPVKSAHGHAVVLEQARQGQLSDGHPKDIHDWQPLVVQGWV